MFEYNLVYAYSCKNMKENIINKIFDCNFIQLSLYSLRSNSVFFLVTAKMRSKSYQVVSEKCSENFPERNVPNKSTIWKNVKKYREEGTKRM